MKEHFRQSMAWLHTWSGLIVGWVLFFVFVTGTAGYFQYQITQWMQPERLVVRAPVSEDRAAMLDHALNRLETVAPVAASWRITLPHESFAGRGWQEFSIRWEEMPQPGHEWGASGSERLDPATGAMLPAGPEPRDTAGGGGLYRMHYVLHYLPYEWAIRIVGACTMLMLLAIVSGVITHKKIFKDFFTFRPGKGQRSWLDAHNAISVMALPFFLMITYSGLVFFLFTYMPAGRDVLYGTGPTARTAYFDELHEHGEHAHAPIGRPVVPVAPLVAQAEEAWGRGQVASIVIERHEGEPPEIVVARVPGGSVDFWNPPTLRFHAETGESLGPEPPTGGSAALTQSVMLNLHEGLFADIWGRWLYFIAGLLGCAMIGTGLVLWTVKRRRHHLASGSEGGEHPGVRLVETLNVATIAGLPLAVAAYFCANRLLPVELAERAAWELHSLFAVWLGTWFYAQARPLRRAWVELLWAACAAYAFVPVLNALTTDRHLGQTLPAGDWGLAGFDLTMWGLAAILAVMAVKVQRRLAPAARPTEIHARAVPGKEAA
ncbi:PepSY-associated TM helix domain-containing protein [Thauera linaloolentis]|uniref:PepSY-associated TM helix domain-containing protein n=1 Tax=Thauera linaloolentis (strain DSM 12138 / JCM 21573 / CCUG 41526 / CIP 105981 / IAM 15112 / NBRC 102519 / 47Lol) TaxID=1123367 RepID=N6Z7C1_THAL4|nr:PepSY-associated TM helix domain-containing protein [Thauera linaloolentis]ENO90447.1 PepSY-associated TM helix domain-containing protein [Thauera linaloolentis 47Lol = DSM 12138]MCM8566308.1 PepSY domain-containing protein [Thauera linaloolentis]